MWMVPAATLADGFGVWLASVGGAHPPEVRAAVVRVGVGRQIHPLPCVWRHRDFGSVRCWYARSSLTGLCPDTIYDVTLLDDQGRAHDAAKVRTLPSAVPAMGERPLVLHLSSCFSAQRDQGGGVKREAGRLAGPDLPHAKLLCGDQVYLDLPAEEWLPRKPRALRERLVAKYLRHWAPLRDSREAGFGALLRTGGNLFVSDDHELWNNYPFAQAHLKSTWLRGQRAELEAACLELLHTFQFPGEPGDGPPLTQLRIGPADAPEAFELVCLDGRAARSETLAHDPSHLDAVCDWLGTLKGPGALVLSQPLFEKPQGRVRARFQDSGLADMDDYLQLTAALCAAPHDVLALSGDIHCGRISRVPLARGRQLYEVVSSPLGLLTPSDRKQAKPHRRFPTHGAPANDVELRFGPVGDDHYASLSLWRAGPGLRVKVDFRLTGAAAPVLRSHEFSLY